MKGDWSKSKLIRLEHHLMRGEMSFTEIAKVFDVDRSNLWRVVKANKIDTTPVFSSYNRKERTVCYQLRRLGLGCEDIISTPSYCSITNVRLTYDIYLDKPNSAIVVPNDDGYMIVAKGYADAKLNR